MKDALPQKINNAECGIINLENSDENGRHWTAYYKNNDKKCYFDSYGKAPPPKKLLNIQIQKICFIIMKEFKIIMIH
jgi:hypothetical protein